MKKILNRFAIWLMIKTHTVTATEIAMIEEAKKRFILNKDQMYNDINRDQSYKEVNSTPHKQL